jgi:general stress protein YciG
MTGKSRRGFASMDAERRREIAAKGGRTAHERGTAHQWSTDEARQAGQKGGIVVSRDRAHMSAIGREGGESRKAALRGGGKVGARGPVEREVAIPVVADGRAAEDDLRPTPSVGRSTETPRAAQ